VCLDEDPENVWQKRLIFYNHFMQMKQITNIPKIYWDEEESYSYLPEEEAKKTENDCYFVSKSEKWCQLHCHWLLHFFYTTPSVPKYKQKWVNKSWCI
jgi:hypothetical protein